MIKIHISKVSLPNTYTKVFDTVKDAVGFMRGQQCGTCMRAKKQKIGFSLI